MVKDDGNSLETRENPAKIIQNNTLLPSSGFRASKKRILFFKNEARKLLKTQGGCGKNSQNEPKTKLKQS